MFRVDSFEGHVVSVDSEPVTKRVSITLLTPIHHSGSGRRGGLMVSVLDFGSSGPGSSPARGHCVVFLDKTLNSHSASVHPGV